MGYVDDCCGFFSRNKYCWKGSLVCINTSMILFSVANMVNKGESVKDCDPQLFWATTLLVSYFCFLWLRYVIFIIVQCAGHCES